jgi:hypothetical protein
VGDDGHPFSFFAMRYTTYTIRGGVFCTNVELTQSGKNDKMKSKGQKSASQIQFRKELEK